jgi:hypothetical protein
MRTILKQFVLTLILVIIPIYSYSQKMKVTYQETGPSSSVHAISNGDNVSLGNLGDKFSGIYYGKAYYIKIKNTDSANDLIISNVKLGNNRYITLSDFNTVSVITTSNEYQIFMTYQVPGTITRETTFIEFTTNDPLNKNVRIDFIVNPDNGEFAFTAEAPHTINNNTIDIGNIKLNESINITYYAKNIGAGYAGLSEVKDIVTNNKLTSSFNKYSTFAHNATQQIDLTFQAKTPGDINTQFTHEITKGKVAKQTFRITGKVIAPQLQITNGGTVVNEGDEVELPEIVYSSGTSAYTRNIPIENIGGDILRISKFTIEGDNDNEFSVSGTTYFNANSKGSINLRISPYAHGERRIKIRIKSNSHSNPDTYIYAKVVIRAPYLSLLDEDGNTYNYNDEFMVGTSTGGNKITKNLIFKNTGNRTMNISRLYIELLEDHKTFSITNTPKKSLAPNEQTNVTIEYNPKAISKKENPKTRLYIMANTMKMYYSFGIKAGNSYSDVLLKKNSINYKNTSTLVFDKVSVNNPYTETLTLTNSGNTDLNLSNFSITDDNSNYFSIVEPSSDIVVKPGENINLKIKFTPKIKVNDYKAKLKFTTNDYEDPNFTLNLQGASIKPTIKVYDPSNNDITHNSVTNKVTITHPLTKTVQYKIKNYGTDKLRVTDITVDTPDGITAKVIYTDTELDYAKSNQLSIEYKATKPGHYKTKVKLKTNDYEAPEFVFYNSFIAMVPSLEVATDKVIANNSSVDFGNNAILEFSLRNAGSHTLNINSVTIDGADKDNFTVKASSNTIVSNTDIKAVVIYRPDRSGVKTANLIINSDDPVNPVFTIVIKADDNTPAPTEPDLEVKHKGSSISSNQNIDFGTTADATEEFTIKNSGKGVLNINSITISGANKSDFNISSYNKSVDTGKETTFRVTYRSDAVGKKSAVVTISTNDNDTPSFIINVTAETKKSTSIDNIDSDMFSVYPNPFSDHINISNTEVKEFMVNIYNINGVKIISKKVTDTTISITTDIPSGIYIVEILRDNRTYKYKVIRE